MINSQGDEHTINFNLTLEDNNEEENMGEVCEEIPTEKRGSRRNLALP
jgi:hypothetical protein